MNEAALHELLSGRRKGFGAALLRCGLHVASWGYSAGTQLRNLAYDRQWLRIHRATVPVISLGNITTGGTGKTPMAAWLANWLIAQGSKPGLLSRGYRSLDRESRSDSDTLAHEPPPENDEKRVLDRLCPGVPHIQNRDRVSSAKQIVSEFGCNVLLMDDGFQHRRLHRDLDLVLIDALQPWGYGHLLPRGLLREPLSGLRRADLILVTRVDQCSSSEHQSLLARLRKIRGTDECIEVRFAPLRLVDREGQIQPPGIVAGRSTIAFCGIGSPNGFRQTVASLQSSCHRVAVYPDHHHYGEQDLSQLAESARELSAEFVLTTQKDLVKIAPNAWNGPPLFAIEIGVEFPKGNTLLESRLRQLTRSDVPSNSPEQ